MASPQERGRQNPDPRLTLKMLRQALDCTIFLDDFEEGRVQLQLLLCQLRGHPNTIHGRLEMATNKLASTRLTLEVLQQLGVAPTQTRRLLGDLLKLIGDQEELTAGGS
jgi:hypothetical protein